MTRANTQRHGDEQDLSLSDQDASQVRGGDAAKPQPPDVAKELFKVKLPGSILGSMSSNANE